MSGPFVYKPPKTPITYSWPQWEQTPFDVNSPGPTTPFIPNSPFVPPTPFSNSRLRSIDTSPHLPVMDFTCLNADAPGDHLFERRSSAYSAACDEPWVAVRDRRPSWHGDGRSLWPVARQTGSSYQLDYGLSGPGHHRRRSHNDVSFSQQFPKLQVHPFLDADPNFSLDLMYPYKPHLIFGRGERVAVPEEELARPATYPAVTRMRIFCDELPKDWDLDFELSSEQSQYYARTGYEPPHITVSDVLLNLHRYLHETVSHAEWQELTPGSKSETSRAFSCRCRVTSRTKDECDKEVAAGVRRIDYLKGKTQFVGLSRLETEKGVEIMKLMTRYPVGVVQ